MMKSFIKVLLAAAALFVSPGASAYGIFEADGIYYYITSEADKTVEVTSVDNKYVVDVSIPATVEYGGDTYTVTKIGGFSYCSDLTSVDIPDGVISIGNSAFIGCSSLASIDIPDGVVSIGDYAFTECSSLTSVDIPDGVTSLGDGAFCYCSGLESVTLGSGLETIGDWAFEGCSSLAEITCRATVPPVCGQDCFADVDISNCTLSVPEWAEEAYKTADVWKEFLYEYFMSGGIRYGALTSSQGNIAMVVAGGDYRGGITIPATVENGGITYTVTSIKGYAFAECSDLVSVDIPDGVVSIGDAAFAMCSSLTSVDIPNGVTSIEYRAFMGCGLTSIDIPDGVVSIGESAFSDCFSLESVTLGSGLETIGDYAFMSCINLKSINIPDGVVSIGDYAFSSCGRLESVDIPDGITSIGDYAFSDCSSLASIDIPDGVVSIGENTFSGCASLESVTLGSGLETIGDEAFMGCGSLAEITCRATVPPVCGQDCFAYVDISNCTLSVPEGTEEAYKTADVWKEFFYEYFISGGIKYSAQTSPQGNIATVLAGEYTGDITIPATVENGGITYTVTSIGDRAFYYCSSLESVTLGSGLETIGDYAFYGCRSLAEINSLATLPPVCGAYSFYGVDKNACALNVYAAAGRIVVENAAAGTPIAVYTADGVQVYGGTASGGRTEIPAQAGKLYIVRCGNAAYKTAM